MTGLERQFLHILKAAIQGQAAQMPEHLSQQDCRALLAMAQTHRVLPLFYEAVYTWDAFRDDPMHAALRQQIRQQVLAQTLRTNDFLGLNNRLVSAGLTPLVVKGIICRDLYPYPDHRPSGDEDVLIPPAQLEKCRAIFEDYGLQTAEDPESYEIPYRKPGSPLFIELHKSLFPPDSEAYGELNRLFTGVCDRAISLTVQGCQVWTMDPSDHLLYLICHAFKHFLHSGFGIRQLCDIILFANRYGKEIHWQWVMDGCRSIRAEKFAAALFQIGKKYLVFDPEKACYPAQWQQLSVDETAMLEDLLCGGLYGDNTMSRIHSSSITLDAVAAHKQGKKSKPSILLSAFPPAEKLYKRYPYLKEKPYLLPVAWGSRILTYRSQSRRNPDNSAADALKIGKNRVALMKQYEIIP